MFMQLKNYAHCHIITAWLYIFVVSRLRTAWAPPSLASRWPATVMSRATRWRASTATPTTTASPTQSPMWPMPTASSRRPTTCRRPCPPSTRLRRWRQPRPATRPPPPPATRPPPPPPPPSLSTSSTSPGTSDLSLFPLQESHTVYTLISPRIYCDELSVIYTCVWAFAHVILIYVHWHIMYFLNGRYTQDFLYTTKISRRTGEAAVCIVYRHILPSHC